MLRELLLVALTTVSYASALTLTSSDNPNITYSQNDFIASDSLTYRLGDYQITELEYFTDEISTHYSFIEVIIPHAVFDELSNYDIVYISIPYFRYTNTKDLSMRINLYDDNQFFGSAFSSYSVLPLSETMCAHYGYTVVDIPPFTYPPNLYNFFDPALWDYNYLNYEIRLRFTVPTYYTIEFPFFMYEITLFTKLNSYYYGYSDGYDDGYDYGFDDGFNDGYADGIAEGITQADGTWLGNLIFGTVGSVVGFIFAISDFEVLGVSIMSIITLFVAIGIIMLFIKLIKGTN